MRVTTFVVGCLPAMAEKEMACQLHTSNQWKESFMNPPVSLRVRSMKYLSTVPVMCLGIVVWLCLASGASQGQDFRVLYSIFDAQSGVKFYGNRAPLVPGPDGLLYGTTYAGSHSFGAVYSAKTDGTGLTMLKSFNQTSSVGEGLPTVVIVDRTTLYGGTIHGGLSDVGTLFRLNTDGSG